MLFRSWSQNSFTYIRWLCKITDLFSDNAKIFSNHARKKHIDVDDVRVAVQMYTDKNVTSPPPRDMLLEVARTKNSSTLPIPKSTSGLRLPPDRFCLTSCNLKLKSNKKQPPRSGPYYYGSAAASTTSSMMMPKNKVRKCNREPQRYCHSSPIDGVCI